MKIFDPKRHLPPGWNWEGTKVNLLWGHAISAMTTLSFLGRYFDARELLYRYVPGPTGTYIPELVPTRTIAPFRELLGGFPLLGLWCFLAVMPILVWRYYHFHTQGAMSIYTMRRLPDPMELHRRCWMQPILSALAEILMFAVLTGLCWCLWWFATPLPCRPI